MTNVCMWFFLKFNVDTYNPLNGSPSSFCGGTLLYGSNLWSDSDFEM